MRLVRIAQSSDGTFGVLTKDNMPLCVTLEDPWNDNKKQISCIPAGAYTCIRHNGGKYQKVWEIVKVPNRSSILIHNGNTTDDTIGCVLVGRYFGKVNGKYGILQSVPVLNELRDLLPSTFKLEIINAF